mgnify:CR=1 FL=1
MSATSAATSGRRKLFVTTALPYANGPFHIGHISGVHPGRHLGALPADAEATTCISSARTTRTARRSCCRPKPRASRRRRSSRSIAATRPKHLERLPHQLRPLALDGLAGERRAVAGHLPQAEATACLRSTTKPVEQFYDPVKEMFLPDRYIKGECPKCGAKDQYADACENCGTVNAPTDLKNPYSTVSGATPVLQVVGPFLLPALRSGMRRIPAAAGRAGRRASALQPEVAEQGARVAGRRRRTAKVSPTGTSRATRRTSASRSPTRPANTSTSGSTRPIGYLASLKSYVDAARQAGRTRASPSSCRAADVEQYPLHRQGHRLLPHAVLAGDAEVRRAPYKVPDNVFVHGFITALGEKMSKSRGTGISPDVLPRPRARTRSGCATTSPRSSTTKVEDIDFNPDDFVARVNSDLIGKYVNIASRAATVHHQAFRRQAVATRAETGQIARARRLDDDRVGIRRGIARGLRGTRVRQGAARGDADRRIGSTSASTRRSRGSSRKDPARRDELQDVCTDALNAFRVLTYYLAPVLPVLADTRRADCSTCPLPLRWDDIEQVATSIRPYEHLMTRIDPKQIDALLEGPQSRRPRPHRQPLAAVPARSRRRAPITISDRRLRQRSICASRGSSTPSTSTAPTSC